MERLLFIPTYRCQRRGCNGTNNSLASLHIPLSLFDQRKRDHGEMRETVDPTERTKWDCERANMWVNARRLAVQRNTKGDRSGNVHELFWRENHGMTSRKKYSRWKRKKYRRFSDWEFFIRKHSERKLMQVLRIMRLEKIVMKKGIIKIDELNSEKKD